LKNGGGYNDSISTTKNHDENDDLLDGHKVSACITAAIIKTRIINSKLLEDSDDNEFTLLNSNRMNEQVAMLSGISCLLEYMADDRENLCLPTEDKVVLRLPKTKYEDRSSYLDSIIRALYYTNLTNGMSTLLLSNIFFFIERYHRKCIESELLMN
jgi:hypothetical protein